MQKNKGKKKIPPPPPPTPWSSQITILNSPNMDTY